MKLKVFILLALVLLVFSTPIFVTANVSAPKLNSALRGITKSDSPLQPCGDPIGDDPDVPH